MVNGDFRNSFQEERKAPLLMRNFAILFEKGVRRHGQVADTEKIKQKTQDLTPASGGQTPTTPGQLQPTLAIPSWSWPAPTKFS